MRHACSNQNQLRTNRRGAIVVIIVVLLIPLLAFMAFCVDIGWITVTKSELQNAADASAAAGARQLVDNYSSYSNPLQLNRTGLISSATANASRYATQFGGYNSAGGVSSLAILPQDIQYGFTDANGNFTASLARYPNTVQVTARRDGSANSPLPLFFARAIGRRDTDLTATASATIYTGLITSFDPSGGGEGSGEEFTAGDGGGWGEDFDNAGGGDNCLMLPVAFDVNYWKSFVKSGLSPDLLPHTDETGSPQIQVYPSPRNAPGNFGLLCIGPWTNATPEFRDWIIDGPTDDDIQALLTAGSLPVSEDEPKPWKGTPGLRDTLRDEFEAIIGQPRLLPLFKPASLTPYQAASGHGSNATYDIVGFVGVMVTEVVGHGSNLKISVKPCDVMDPTAVFDPSTLYPAGAEPANQLRSFTHTAPKFTR